MEKLFIYLNILKDQSSKSPFLNIDDPDNFILIENWIKYFAVTMEILH